MMSTNIAIAFVTLTKTFVTITKIWTPIYNCSPHFSIHCTIPQVSKCLVAALKHMLEKYYNYNLWIILRIPTFYQHFCFYLIPTLLNSLWSQRLMFFTSFGILMQLALICLGRELYSSIQHCVLLSNHHQYQGSLCSLSHHTGVLKRLHFYSFGSASQQMTNFKTTPHFHWLDGMHFTRQHTFFLLFLSFCFLKFIFKFI